MRLNFVQPNHKSELVGIFGFLLANHDKATLQHFSALTKKRSLLAALFEKKRQVGTNFFFNPAKNRCCYV
jgi:hypothetical protein